MKLRVLESGPGLQATLQDAGRTGALAHGVPFSGAMDAHSHALANLLLGNEVGASTLECSGGKFSAWVEKGGRLALAGAGGVLYLDKKPVTSERVVHLPEGVLLEIQPSRNGNFCYLATTGGWQAALVLGSTSTYLAGGFGGYEGRALRKGDVLHANTETVAPLQTTANRWFISHSETTQPQLEKPLDIAVLEGPEWSLWSTAQQQAFLAQPARISKDRSRQAVRIEGLDFLRHSFGTLYSSGVTPGAIQVPPGDFPAILMADAQTTGGFPRIAQVIAVDLPKIAQGKTGLLLRFRMVTLAEATQRLLEYHEQLARLKTAIRLRDSQL